MGYILASSLLLTNSRQQPYNCTKGLLYIATPANIRNEFMYRSMQTDQTKANNYRKVDLCLPKWQKSLKRKNKPKNLNK